MFHYPHIDPIAFSLGPVKIHWYGIMYLVGFVSGWALLTYRAKKPHSGWTPEQVYDILFYTAIGVVVGGRVGYILFYYLPFYGIAQYLHQPWLVFKIWDGGMSFHGGLIGVLLAMWLYSRSVNKTFFQLMDFIAPVVPIGLGAGRIGNFINGELWGRVTHAPWGMIYPQAGPLPRHPSEIYEFLLEGVTLFLILWFYSLKPKPRMAVSGMFALCYGCFRFFCEFFRQPDPQAGFIAWGWLTMGQLLSVPLIIIGALLLILAYRCKNKTIHVA